VRSLVIIALVGGLANRAEADLADDLVAAATEPERAAVRDRARAAILDRLDTEIFPARMGTPWAELGCSAFVAASLADAGFELADRSGFVRARALEIQRSLAPRDDQIHRFRDIDADLLAAEIASLGDGLYLIGLRYHIGFVRVSGGRVELVHSGRDGPATVRREPLELARVVIRSRPSGYWVTPALPDDLIDRWLLGKKVSLSAAGR
jgi:hypothetical protein